MSSGQLNCAQGVFNAGSLSSSSFCSCSRSQVPQLPGSDASPNAMCWGEGEVAACLTSSSIFALSEL